jgi:hypothetical protein
LFAVLSWVGQPIGKVVIAGYVDPEPDPALHLESLSVTLITISTTPAVQFLLMPILSYLRNWYKVPLR